MTLCAPALTSLCELVLPLMLRAITNMRRQNLASLTLGFILQVGAVYLVLRVLDAAANYFMQSTGHVMGAHIETDMRRDAFDHLQRCPTPILPTPRWARSWGASPTTCLT